MSAAPATRGIETDDVELLVAIQTPYLPVTLVDGYFSNWRTESVARIQLAAVSQLTPVSAPFALPIPRQAPVTETSCSWNQPLFLALMGKEAVLLSAVARESAVPACV